MYLEKGIPCQIVTLGLLQEGKNIRSICNKLLNQICAKTSGIPWIISNMPFNNIPTVFYFYNIFNIIQLIQNFEKKSIQFILKNIFKIF